MLASRVLVVRISVELLASGVAPSVVSWLVGNGWGMVCGHDGWMMLRGGDRMGNGLMRMALIMFSGCKWRTT